MICDEANVEEDLYTNDHSLYSSYKQRTANLHGLAVLY